MKIAVVCANGKAGSLIVREAVERGLDVTAVVRSENQSATQQVIQKDLFHLKASLFAVSPQENFIFLTRLPQKLQRRPYCTTSRHTKTA